MNYNKVKSKNIKADIIYIGFLFCIYNFTTYYVSFLNHTTHDFINVVTVMMVLVSVSYNVFFLKESKESKTSELFSFLIMSSNKVLKKKAFTRKLSSTEKTLLLSFLVKGFYIPLMLSFTVSNYYLLKQNLSEFDYNGFNDFTTFFNSYLFYLLLSLFFFIDTVIFTFGYLFESKLLKNKIKSVDTSILGWSVALLCYPPFNGIMSYLVIWTPRDNAYFFNDTVTLILRLVIVILVLVYVTATLNLGFKASNLTNRGIVTNGVYSLVRHPAYFSKVLYWWITSIPFIIVQPIAILGVITWTVLYVLRAITEEKHLKKDIDYVNYCKKVRYRFIPFVY
jgi:protein-S-isoprenylcysteine O-methyltransferase Ste14